jgi:hypothetical protein
MPGAAVDPEAQSGEVKIHHEELFVQHYAHPSLSFIMKRGVELNGCEWIMHGVTFGTVHAPRPWPRVDRFAR